MSDRIQLRRDTAANWSSVNPVLAQAEVGVVTDEHYHKIGDGVTPWNDLPEQFPDHIREGDSRLSDARTPTSHTHPWSEVNDKPDLVVQSEIGTAAALDVTTGDMDTSGVGVLRRGNYGIGIYDELGVPLEDYTDLLPNGFYSGAGSLSANYPFGGGGRRFGALINCNRYNNQFRLLMDSEGVTYTFISNDGTGRKDTLLYSNENILGAVSQSGGAPTGAIIERGSNANGEYTKFADGRIIITKERVVLSYDSAPFLLGNPSFPVALIDRDYSISYSFRPSDSNSAAFGFADDATPGATSIGQVAFRKTPSDCPFRVARVSGMADFQPGDALYIDLTIIGRWY